MKKLKPLFLFSGLLICIQSFGQSFILQETNIKKNTSQCINAAKKCKLVLLKKQTMYTLPFSNKSTLTNNALNALSEKFMKVFPKEVPYDVDGVVIERAPRNERDQVVKLSYGFLAAGKKETTNYVLLIVTFENSGASPKIDNIQVKRMDEIGVLALTEREMLKFKKEPEPKPAAKPVKKPAAKKKA